jgi:predicted RNase H-like HicB family nuclease
MEVRNMTSERIYRVLRSFKVNVEECDDDDDMGKRYRACCLELTGCTVDASTKSEALCRIREAIDVWIDLVQRQLTDEERYFADMIDMTLGHTSRQLKVAGENGKAKVKKPVVQVTWLDAAHQEDDIEEKDIAGLQPSRMVSFGLLMADDDERVTISSHVATDVAESGDAQIDYRDTLVIPRQSVLAIEMLGELEVG